MTEYKDKLNSFASRLKNEPFNSPIQEVRPKTKKRRILNQKLSSIFGYQKP